MTIKELHKITLRGEPYIKGNFSKQKIRAELANNTDYDVEKTSSGEENARILDRLNSTPISALDEALSEKDQYLSFEESYLGMCYTLSATNPRIYEVLKPRFEEAYGGAEFDEQCAFAMGTSFLCDLAKKESLVGITAEEIAGSVAASMMDVIYRVPLQEAIDTCGMGGDKGFTINGEKKKTINASTLSGIVLASLGYDVVKHGSYGNTLKMGSTEAIEDMGANIHQATPEEILSLLRETGFHFSDAHLFKTLHDLSHKLRKETINHFIGPMTTPVSKDTLLHRVMGVNHKIHPREVAKAYQILNETGFQSVGNVLVVSGLGENYANVFDIYSHRELREHMILDEASPYATLVGIVQNGKYLGCSLVSLEDFGVDLDPSKVGVEYSEQSIAEMNRLALTGQHKTNSDYLAVNAALGLFTIKYLGLENTVVDGRLNPKYLRESFEECQDSIYSGLAEERLRKIVEVSNR